MDCWCDGLDLLEPITEVWDEGVAKRTAFPMLIGSEKPDMNSGGAPKPFWMGQFTGSECTEESEADALRDGFMRPDDRRTLLGLLYDSLWLGKADTTSPVSAQKQKRKAPVERLQKVDQPDAPPPERTGPAFTQMQSAPPQDEEKSPAPLRSELGGVEEPRTRCKTETGSNSRS